MPGGPRAGGAELAEDGRERALQIGDDLVDEADPQGGRGVEALARDEVAAGGALADLPDRVGRDHRRDDPELHLGEGEDGPLVGERDVGGGHEAGAAAEGVPLDERDHGRRAGVDRVEHPPQRVRVGDVLVVGEGDRAAHPLDVGAGAEARPVAREHDGTRLADVDERLGELLDQRRVEGVARLGAGQGDAEDVVVPFDPQRVHVTAV